MKKVSDIVNIPQLNLVDDRTSAWQRREYLLALQLGLYTTGKTLTELTNRNTSANTGSSRNRYE